LVNPLGEFRGENETEEYFLNEYLPLHLANRENSLAERRTHISAIKRCFRLPDRPRHLDVGCALGSMLQESKMAGWDPIGVETSEFAAKYAAEHTRCPVYAGTLQKAAFSCESFDVVTLMDVIEHVPEPSELMNEIYRVLRPGGVVFIVTPNFASFFVWLYGPKAYAIWPDQHVIYFQPSTMTKFLRRVGFARTITGSKDFYGENLRRLLRAMERRQMWKSKPRLARKLHWENCGGSPIECSCMFRSGTSSSPSRKSDFSSDDCASIFALCSHQQ
jgi:2-polyprenyl-3-methyl-5-hydroxy-6-metoxy-1,4-benzoquinol methylase